MSRMGKRTLSALLAVVVSTACSERLPDADQIKSDLIGQTVGNVIFRWRFESLNEFESFAITNQERTGDVVEYTANVILTEPRGRSSATLTIVYRLEDNGWSLASVSDNRTLKRR